MKTQQPSNWLKMSDALRTLAAGFEKVDDVEKHGGFTLPAFSASVLNGKANGHTNGNGHSNGNGAKAKALPAPQKVKKAVKALPAPAAEKAIVKAKAAPKAVKAEKPAKAAKAKGSAASAIAAGRRAVVNGDRPKLVDAVAIVMGDETLRAGDILARLTELGWEPGASAKQAYISYTLSDNGEVFKRGNRGEYSVIKPKNFVELTNQWGASKIAKAKAVTAKAAPEAKAAPKGPKASGGKTSGKAEGVASTDAGEAEVLTAPAVVTEAQPVAGDPPTTTPDATASVPPTTDTTLTELGENPFDAL